MLEMLMEMLQGGSDALNNVVELAKAMETIAKALESISAFFAPILALFEGLGIFG